MPCDECDYNMQCKDHVSSITSTAGIHYEAIIYRSTLVKPVFASSASEMMVLTPLMGRNHFLEAMILKSLMWNPIQNAMAWPMPR